MSPDDAESIALAPVAVTSTDSKRLMVLCSSAATAGSGPPILNAVRASAPPTVVILFFLAMRMGPARVVTGFCTRISLGEIYLISLFWVLTAVLCHICKMYNTGFGVESTNANWLKLPDLAAKCTLETCRRARRRDSLRRRRPGRRRFAGRD